MQVDFYILNSTDLHAKWDFVARLTEKIYRQRLRVQLLVADVTAAQDLDALLWTYRPESFLPHEIISAGKAMQAPILITHDPTLLYPYEVLLNFTDIPLEYRPEITRIAEVVCQQPEDLQTSRSRYRQYQQRGYAVKTHKV